MRTEDRRHQVVEQVRGAGRVLVTELAEHFDAIPEMVHRDLAALDCNGALRKIRGGAIPAPALPGTGVTQREQVNPTAKQAIARVVLAQLILKPDATLLIDAETTTGSLARLLPGDSDLTVITNSVPTTIWLVSAGRIRVRILDDQLREFIQAAVGPEAVKALSTLRVDVAVLRTNGPSAVHGLSTPDPDEATVKHAMVRSARQVITLTSSTRVDQGHLVSFTSLDDIDLLVTDVELPPALIDQLTATETEVLVVQS